MSTRLISARRAAAVFSLVIACAFAVSAQQQSMEGKTAEQFYKNIKVLKGTPADQLNLAMHLVEGELGVDCTFCHVDHDPAHFPLDDNKNKETARKMMQMVIDINNNTFEGKQVVTCYTCHQGHPLPVSTQWFCPRFVPRDRQLHRPGRSKASHSCAPHSGSDFR